MTWFMPEEGAPHQATWMSFGVNDDIWTAALADDVRETLHLIAETIAEFEPVHALAPPGTRNRRLDIIEFETDDLWMRDTGPTFVHGPADLGGVNFNFNGWGGKQQHARDALVAGEVCAATDTEEIATDLVLEGGALEIDGEGTALITESCVLNDNRNPGWSKGQVEAELLRTIGIEKVIWLPGIAGRDITDGHTDFYARFASPGVVIAARDDDPESFDYAVTREHLRILETATDAHGRAIEVHVIPAPTSPREDYLDDDFAAGYINFYLCNGGVIAPEFGDRKADRHAKKVLQELFPDREVVQLNIDPIAAGGGGIHCTTQQEPRLP